MKPGRLDQFVIASILCLCSIGTVSLAGADTLNVSAVVLSKNNCKINNPTTMNFGVLDPLNPVVATANAALDFVCRGSENVATYLVSANDGLHGTGTNARRMQHVTNLAAFLPYSLQLAASPAGTPQDSPLSGNAEKNITQSLYLTGTVENYQTATAGDYTDQVIISINP